MQKESSIAITGSGIISAIGCGKDNVLSSLQNNVSGIESMKYLDSIHKHLPVGEVKFSNEELKRLLGIDESKIVSRNVLLGAIAVNEALKDAGNIDLQGKRVTLISGTTVGGMDVTESLYSQMLQNDEYLKYMDNHDCGRSTEEIMEICGLTAEVCTISTACSSALNAVMIGAEMLKNDEADIIIAGGTESLSKFHFSGFNSLMILDSERCRPFDQTRAGINLGEGAAFVILEREAEAKAANRNVQAYVSGYGNRCDAFHQTATSENGEGAYLAMQEALKTSGLDASEISYINAHGTGTGNNDRSESVAVQRVFGENIPLISSTKAFTGHTTSASGSIELVICLLAMHHDFVPGNIGWSTPMENGVIPTMGETGVKLSHVLCNSFGFGGNCSALVLSSEKKSEISQVAKRKCKVLAEVEITDDAMLTGIKEFVPPMEARRMGKLLKAATMASQKAIKEAGIDCPDAIVTATALGMLETSEKYLNAMATDGEEALSPTLFMQSTHNTISSAIAMRMKCHGYNITYTQGEKSMEWAMRDAQRLIERGFADTVLVGCYDESAPIFNEFLQRRNMPEKGKIFSKCVILSAE